MFRFLIPLILSIAAANSIQERASPYRLKYAVASESQLKFALENKYDDTGPGAKRPEYAYSTYKNLQDAIIAYLDDPDTKLPESEKAIAVQKLFKNPNYYPRQQIQRHYPKTVEEYTGYNAETERPVYKYTIPEKKPAYYGEEENINLGNFEGNGLSLFKIEKRPEPLNLRKHQAIKGTPLSVAHYTREQEYEEPHDQFNPHPKYTFSYGVHDKKTGDTKSAHETREGGTVHGYYSFLDADGKQRIVHYTADDKLGFRATVQRTNTQL